MITQPAVGTSTSEFKITLALVIAHIGAVAATWINPSGVLSAGQQASIEKWAGVLATALVGLYMTHRTWLKAEIAKAEAAAARYAAPATSAATWATATSQGGLQIITAPEGVTPFDPAAHLDPPPAVAATAPTP